MTSTSAPKSRICKGILLAVLFVGSACGPSRFEEARARDTAAGWRAFVASGKADAEERAHAHRRLDDLLFRAAKQAGDIAAYRRYLDAFEHGRHRASARAVLEKLRYDKAVAQDGLWPLEDFLARHSTGANADQVRLLLAERSRTAALNSQGTAALDLWLSRYPRAAGKAEVEAAFESRSYEAAVSTGTLAALARYQDRFPHAARWEDVELRVRAVEVRAAVLSGDEEAARRLVESKGSPQAREALLAAARMARVERAVARLAGRELRVLARDEAESGLRAAEVVKAIAERKRGGRALMAAAAKLDAPAHSEPIGVWIGALSDRDPRRRRVAARVLGYSRSHLAVPPLVRALADRNMLVADEAGAGLRRLGPSLHPVVRDVTFTRVLRQLEARSVAMDRQAVLGLVLEAADRPAALETMRLASAGDGQSVVRLRLVEVESDPYRRWVALQGVAFRVRDEARARLPALELARRDGPIDLALLRSGRTLQSLLKRCLRHATEVARARAGIGELELPSWAEEAERLVLRLDAALTDAEARARAKDSQFLSFDLDEAHEERLRVENEQLAAVDVLAAGLDVPGVRAAVDRAARSPFAKVRERARRALAGGGQ